MTKNALRKQRNWPSSRPDAVLDVDYQTGHDIAGYWQPRASEAPRDRFNAPLPGAPALLVNQFEKTIAP